MNNLDFFTEYESQKRRAQKIFESLDNKIGSNKNELNEAFFGLVKTAKDREKALKDYFFKITKAPNWQSYSVDLDSTGKQVKIENATPEDLDDAWEFLRQQAASDEFKGAMKQDGDSIIYVKGGKGNNAQPNSDPNQDPNQDQDAQQQNTLPAYQITYDKKSGKYFFGSPERFATKINNAPSEIQVYNWQKSPLKFLFEDPLKFGLREITFDFKEGIVAAARDGFWIGDFAGKFLDAAFIGNSFRGTFSSNNEEWKSKPTAFISGTFKDASKTGILGLDDVKQGNEKSVFHLIQLPPGYSVEILTDKQLRHTITCEKRLDAINTNFIYSVYKGYDIDNSSPERVTLPWEAIREDYNSYNISKKFKSLPDVFTLNNNEKIIELRIVESGTPPLFKFKEKFDEKKKYSEDLVNLRGLKQVSANIPSKSLKFSITSQTDLDNLSKIKGYINSSQFENDLKKASVYLDNKLISSEDIKSKFPYLGNVFTLDVLSEAAVNLANPRKSYGRRTYSSRSSVKNPLTGKKFEDTYEIVEYLNQKYKKDIEANGGKKSNAYKKEYKELYDAVFGEKSMATTTASDSSGPGSSVDVGGMAKEESAVLKRIENFVKYFVYKIDNGKSTNKIRQYFIDLLKTKITIHKEPVKATTTSTTPAATTAPKKDTDPKGFPSKKIKESVVRNEIRKILNDLL